MTQKRDRYQSAELPATLKSNDKPAKTSTNSQIRVDLSADRGVVQDG